MIAGAASGGVAVGVMYLLSMQAEFPLATVPFATSIVLVSGSPETAPAQPRALVGGHILSALIGLLVLKFAGPHAWAAVIAVTLAIFAMLATNSFHPPAGINPLVIVMHAMPWSYLAVPIAAGALILLGYTWAWNNLVRQSPWPQRWW